MAALLLLATSSRAAETGAGVTETEVVLGEPAGFSGPSAGLGVELWRGASAAFAEANANGGVHGRTIRIVVADDAYDAEKAAAAALRLIAKDKVFALFGGVGTPTMVRALPVVLKYHLSEGLFYFANFTGAQPQREPPYSKAVFNVRASYRQETRAMIAAFAGMGRRRIGLLVQDDAYGASGRDGVRRTLKTVGLDIVADTTYPRGQSYEVSMAPQVNILRAAKADAIIAVGSYKACAAFVRDVRRSGWDVPIHNVSFVGADQLLNLVREEEKKGGGHLTKNLINTQVVPSYNDTSLPLVRDYRAAMDRFRPVRPPDVGDATYTPASLYSFGSLEGFLSARAFLAVLRRAGRNLTRQGFYEAAEKMGPFDVGLRFPAELSPTRHQALDDVWFTYVTPNGWEATDDPSKVISAADR